MPHTQAQAHTPAQKSDQNTEHRIHITSADLDTRNIPLDISTPTVIILTHTAHSSSE